MVFVEKKYQKTNKNENKKISNLLIIKDNKNKRPLPLC
jgi:hypothetical protein